MLLGIICNRKKHLVDELQSVTHMYLEGVAEHMNVQPVLIPCPMENGAFDAAPILERVNGILKQEYYLGGTFRTKSQAVAAINQAIELYNTRRPHLKLNYRTPEEMHEKLKIAA